MSEWILDAQEFIRYFRLSSPDIMESCIKAAGNETAIMLACPKCLGQVVRCEIKPLDIPNEGIVWKEHTCITSRSFS